MRELDENTKNYMRFTQDHYVVVDYVGIICSCGDRSETHHEYWEHIGTELVKAKLMVLTDEQLDDMLHDAARDTL